MNQHKNKHHFLHYGVECIVDQGHIQCFTQELAVCGAGRGQRCSQRGQLQVADQGLLDGAVWPKTLLVDDKSNFMEW